MECPPLYKSRLPSAEFKVRIKEFHHQSGAASKAFQNRETFPLQGARCWITYYTVDWALRTAWLTSWSSQILFVLTPTLRTASHLLRTTLTILRTTSHLLMTASHLHWGQAHTYTEESLTSTEDKLNHTEKSLADLLVFINSVGRENIYNSVLGSYQVFEWWRKADRPNQL